MFDQQAQLGDGNRIPWIGFGTYLCTNEEVERACFDALESGYTHLDTAEGYHTEQNIGNVLSRMGQDKPFVTTKLWPGMNDNIKLFDEVVESCELSLKKLGVDKIDLYLIHAPFAGPEKRIEQWKAMVYLRDHGKCRSIGVSNYSISHLEEIKQSGLPLPAANQLELHPLCQHLDIINYCRANGILPIAYSSLAPLSDWRVGQRSAKSSVPYDPTTPTPPPHVLLIASLAAKYTITPSQLLLRWALQHGYPILPKSVHRERIVSNRDLFGFEISNEDMKGLDALEQNTPYAWPTGDPCLTP